MMKKYDMTVFIGIITMAIVIVMFNVNTIKVNVNNTLNDIKEYKQKHIENTTDSIAVAITKLKCPRHLINSYASAIQQESDYFNVDWRWIVAMITQESAWNPVAKSFIATKFKGDALTEYAWGLMMLKGSTAKECAKELGEKYEHKLLFDGPTNIHWGTYYFAMRIMAQGGDIELGVRAYNAGDGGLAMGLSSDKHYKRVLKFYDKINKELQCM